MNHLNNKLKAINNSVLQESLQRDINFGVGNKPDLDGLSNIGSSMLESPFSLEPNLNLQIEEEPIVRQHINNIKNNGALHTNTVSQVVSSNSIKNNEQVSGYNNSVTVIQKNNMAQVTETKQNLGEPKIIKSFTVNLNDNNNNNNNLDEYKGIKMVDSVALSPSDNKLQSSFKDIINNTHTNKIMSVLVIIIIIILICLVKRSSRK